MFLIATYLGRNIAFFVQQKRKNNTRNALLVNGTQKHRVCQTQQGQCPNTVLKTRTLCKRMLSSYAFTHKTKALQSLSEKNLFCPNQDISKTQQGAFRYFNSRTEEMGMFLNKKQLLKLSYFEILSLNTRFLFNTSTKLLLHTKQQCPEYVLKANPCIFFACCRDWNLLQSSTWVDTFLFQLSLK